MHTNKTPIHTSTPLSKKRLLTLAGLGWMFDAMDVGILAFLLAALKLDWGLSGAELGWIGSVNALGMAVGAFVFGLMADRVGRKTVFMLTLVLFSVASGLSALATGLSVLLVLRFFIGMGLGGELPVAATYVSELMPPNERARTVVLLESFWALGWILAALLAYFVIPTYGWRIVMLICALPALYTLYLRRHLPPDSARPRSTLSTRQTLAKLWSPSYRRATLMLWVLWWMVVFSYYGMFLWLPNVMIGKGFTLIKSFEYVLLMTLAQLPGYFTAAYLIERVGRKFVLSVYLAGTALSALAFGQAESLNLLLVAGAFLSFFNLGAWGALYAYTPEQYPADIRASGSGAAAAFGRIGGILGPLTVPYMLQGGFTVSAVFVVFTGALIIGITAVLLLGKETKGTLS